MKLSDLMWILSEVKPQNRNKCDFDFNNLIVYHITSAENVVSIRENGIQAKSSRQSYDRPNSVYFFADKNEVNQDNAGILGLSENRQVLRVSIPVDYVINNMQWDGLYNVSFETYSAVQYFGDIPADWIVDFDYK